MSGDFRRLWMARAISAIGDGIALTSLLVYIKDTEDSGVAVAALLLAESLPNLLGPFTGVIADRYDRRLVMVTCDVAQAAIYTMIAVTVPALPVVILLVGLASVFDATFRPANRAAMPALVAPHDLMRANAWMGGTLNLQLTLGPLAGGLLVAAVGLQGALLADAITFVGSGVLILGLPALRAKGKDSEDPQKVVASLREGVAFAWRHSIARAIFLTLLLGVAFAALDNVALVFLARDVLGSGPTGFGVLMSAFGIGLAVGSFALLRGRAHDPARLYTFGWLLSGIGTLATGLAPTLGVAAFAQSVAGGGNGLENAAGDTLIQRTVPDAMLGRVFGATGTGALLGSSLASLVGGLLLEVAGPRASSSLRGWERSPSS